MKLVGISGSLRKKSYNSAILKIAENIIKSKSPNSSFYNFENLDKIPLFNPELEFEIISSELEVLKDEIKKSDGIIFSTPEYIHAIPGSLKNLFDWLVGSAVLDQKPVIIIIATSSDGNFAKESMHEILTVLTGGKVNEKASFIISGIKTKFNEDLKLIDLNTHEILSKSLELFLNQI